MTNTIANKIGHFDKTEEFYNKPYVINNPKGRLLMFGDLCWVHPTKTSKSKEKFKVQIIAQKLNWVNKDFEWQNGFKQEPSIEICTFVHGGYAAVMNDYLFNRLEPINK